MKILQFFLLFLAVLSSSFCSNSLPRGEDFFRLLTNPYLFFSMRARKIPYEIEEELLYYFTVESFSSVNLSAIRGNGIDVACYIKAITGSSNRDLQMLNLHFTGLVDSHLDLIFHAIMKYKKISLINLSDNQITAKGFISLMQKLTLVKDRKLEIILDGNKIETEDLEECFAPLEGNITCLKYISLDRNNIGFEGAKILSRWFFDENTIVSEDKNDSFNWVLKGNEEFDETMAIIQHNFMNICRSNRPFEFNSNAIEKTSIIGQGSYGKVWEVKEKKRGLRLALKCIQLYHVLISADDAELATLRIANHENLIKSIGVNVSRSSIDILMPLCEYGSLHSLMKIPIKFPIPMIAEIARQIINGLVALNQLCMVHGDIKPNNILVNCEGTVKIADFGFSFDKRWSHRPLKICNLYYRPPEVIKMSEAYDYADMWSFGILLIELMTGVNPFAHLSRDQVNGTLSDPDFSMDPYLAALPDVDARLLDLLTRLLQVDPFKRIKIEAAAKHEFLKLSPGKEEFAEFLRVSTIKNQ